MTADQSTTRRAALRDAVWRASATVVVLVVAYLVIPFEGRSEGSLVVRTVIGLVLLAAAVVWQLRSIPNATHPRLRAGVAVVVAAAASVVLFAALYRMADATDTSAFSETLDHIDGLYLSMATFSTVGFGDIHAVSSTARLLVTLQMVVDVAVLAGAARAAFVVAAHADPRR